MAFPFSVVILTLNEETNLPRCLASVAACEDVVVVDSGSVDQTVAIAKAHGARVVENAFHNFAQQRNFANREADLRHEWVFHLDADETFTPELWQECANFEAEDFDGVWVAPRMMWRGNWLKRCTDFPAWQARFVHRKRFEFIQAGHGQREAPGMRMGRFNAGYHHDLSASGVADWIAKHRRYAEAEAAAYLSSPPPPLAQLWARAAIDRRRALKHFSYALPGRPFFRLVYQYLLRGGVLDGAGAWEYCCLLARYEGFASAAIRAQRGKAHA